MMRYLCWAIMTIHLSSFWYRSVSYFFLLFQTKLNFWTNGWFYLPKVKIIKPWQPWSPPILRRCLPTCQFLCVPSDGIRSIAMQWNWKQAGVSSGAAFASFYCIRSIYGFMNVDKLVARWTEHQLPNYRSASALKCIAASLYRGNSIFLSAVSS